MLAVEAHKEIQKTAKKNIKKLVHIKSMEINEFARQGDVYIRKIKEITGTEKLTNYQLAPGNTKGSRHIVQNKVLIVKGYVGKEMPDDAKGPQIKSDKELRVNHPEHADFILPAGCYQVSYQYDWARQSRVRD